MRWSSPRFLLPLVCLMLLPASGRADVALSTRTALQAAMPAASCDSQRVSTRVDCERGWQAFRRADFPDAAEIWQRAAAERAKPVDDGAPEAVDPHVWREQVDLLILAAHAWERAHEPSRAGMGYIKAAKLADHLAPYLWFKAAENLVQSPAALPPELLRELETHQTLIQEFEAGALVHAQVRAHRDQGLPSAETLTRALTSSRRDAACRWASGALKSAGSAANKQQAAPLHDLLWGHCLPDELTPGYTAPGTVQSPQMRLARAQRWFGVVRFNNALGELNAIPMERLSAVDRCSAEFLRGRTTYRIKKMRNESLGAYQKVAAECRDPQNEDDRIRALYAAGDILYARDQLDAAAAPFETILKDYPQRSHADDAILYLARIARKKKDTAREKALVERAVRDYPDGDMLHEIVWEYVEDAVRAGRHAEFLKTVAGLNLPAFDSNYFSQGRLEYLQGRAHHKLGQSGPAHDAWHRAWRLYPFSFYGYLSRERLIEAGQTPASMDAGAAMLNVDWFLDAGWQRSPAARMARLGLFQMAADLEQARQKQRTPDASPRTDADRWRLAALEHMAGRFPVSHNLARRQIDGRPWAEPADGRLARWEIAWPDPFRADILRAVVAEQRQAKPGVIVEPALPAAIMREESSFIEDIESYAGALGLMQLMPATARDHDRDIPGGSTRQNLLTSLVNIRIGVDHLYTLAQRFNNQPVVIAAAYNAGGGAVNGWIRRNRSDDIALWVEDIPYDQTRNYTKRVIGSYAAYQWLRGIQDLDPTVLTMP